MKKSVFILIGTLIGMIDIHSVMTKPLLDQLTDDNLGSEDFDRPTQNFQFNPKPRPLLQDDFTTPNKYRSLDYSQKRSLFEDSASNLDTNEDMQRRQVGVVYKEDKPIGILQPYQRSYRFIPVKDEPMINDQEPYYGAVGLEKRSLPEVNLAGDQYLEESYPSIYTNFKIDSKLERKRDYDFNDGNIRQLRDTVRRLRSAKSHNSQKFEEELKSILDDMGLIEDNNRIEKRQVEREFSDTPLKSPDANCPSGNNLMAIEQRNQVKTDFNRSPPSDDDLEASKSRRKRQRTALSDNVDLMENLKDSGELRLTGNKSPLAYKTETARGLAKEVIADEDLLEKEDGNRFAHEIQKRLSSLRERVQRELRDASADAAGPPDEEAADDGQRRKRRAAGLQEGESDAINPVLHPDGELKTYVRKKRALEYEEEEEEEGEEPEEEAERYERMRRSNQVLSEKQKKHLKENEEAGDILEEQAWGEEAAAVQKRSASAAAAAAAEQAEEEEEYAGGGPEERGKREEEEEEEENCYAVEDERAKRSVGAAASRRRAVEAHASYARRERAAEAAAERRRRMIDEDQAMENRPRQLGDMSDLDLFGALPKSYNGELSRYKRV